MKWSAQKGALPVTTSAKAQRQKEQFEYDTPAWTLTDAEIAEIDAAGAKAPFRKFWGQAQNPQWDD